jgi:hypothetical protein
MTTKSKGSIAVREACHEETQVNFSPLSRIFPFITLCSCCNRSVSDFMTCYKYLSVKTLIFAEAETTHLDITIDEPYSRQYLLGRQSLYLLWNVIPSLFWWLIWRRVH